MAPQNQAAYLDGKAAKLRVGPAEYPQPGPDEVVIQNHAVAINPVDWKIQDYGFFIQNWPGVLGEDSAGEIVEVGSNISSFKKGDRVLHHSIMLVKQNAAYGAFQNYTLAPASTTALLPSNTTYAQGAVLPLALDTAAVGLYTPHSEGGLGLPLPTTSKPTTSTSPQKTILVWGGSSSVGALTIQLAVQSGARVIATASKHNFDFVKNAGASEVFDYNDSNVVADVVASVLKSGKEQFLGIYDAISLAETFKSAGQILEGVGAGNLATVLNPPDSKELPGFVKVKHVFGVSEITHPIWRDYITKALESGSLRPIPEPLVVGKGLESVQAGLDKNKSGVSAKKVVVEL